MPKEEQTFCPNSRQEWRTWLHNKHKTELSIWLIFYKTSAKVPTLTWSEAVDEALCFGWIDSTKKTIDNEIYMQYFCPRKPKSNWSKINKAKVEQLINNKLMTNAGLSCIETAKENGSWNFLDDVEDVIIPADLKEELIKNTTAMDYFESLSDSAKKIMLYWVISAKRAETRQKRIGEIVTNACEGLKPKQFR